MMKAFTRWFGVSLVTSAALWAADATWIEKAGGTVTRDAGPVKGGTTVIAFVQDPDGYKIELIQTRD